jgi:hypothetical protein
MHRFRAYVLTIPANLPSARETCAHLVSKGFPEPAIFLNTPVQNPTHINQVHRNIFEGHYQIVEAFHRDHFRHDRGLHLLVFEDDALVMRDDAAQILASKVEYLERRRPKWSMLNLGCASLGPAFPVGHGLAIVLAGFSVHAVCYNGGETGRIVRMGRAVCERPFWPEGGRVFSLRSRFALLWPIVTQTRVPKEFIFKHVPVLRHVVTYERALVLLMLVSCLAPLILLAALFRIAWFLYQYKQPRQQNLRTSILGQ